MLKTGTGMAKRHSSSVAIPRVSATGPRIVRLRADAEFAKRFEPETAGNAGRIAVRSREAVAMGEPVVVELSFGALADEVQLRGRVERIDETQGGAPRITIVIDRAHRDRAAYVRKVLAGDRNASARNHRRIPTDLAASWRSNGHRVASRIRDISRGGAFIVSRRLPSLGELVSVEFSAAAGPTSALRVEGTVSWVRAKGREAGFGVSFKLRDREVAAALHQVVRDQERATEPR